VPRKPNKKITPTPLRDALPAWANWIESDRYDRRAFSDLRENSPSLRELERAGGTLVPHFADLLQDLFCLLFKYNIIFHDEKDVVASAGLNRTLLAALHEHELIHLLREMTLLDEAKASLSTLLIGEGLLELLKSEKTVTRRDMLDLWNVERQEELVAETRETLEHAEELSESSEAGSESENLEKVKETLARRYQSRTRLGKRLGRSGEVGLCARIRRPITRCPQTRIGQKTGGQ